MRRPPVLNILKMLAQGLRTHTNGRGLRSIQIRATNVYPLATGSLPYLYPALVDTDLGAECVAAIPQRTPSEPKTQRIHATVIPSPYKLRTKSGERTSLVQVARKYFKMRLASFEPIRILISRVEHSPVAQW